MSPEHVAKLVESARKVAENAYAPYSGFQVGAAIAADDGKTYLGCNVENSTFGATVCAERSAVSAMVAGGGKAVLAVAVYTSAETPTFPCGVCRQVLNEFAPSADTQGDGTLVIAAIDGKQEQMPLSELLPRAFLFRS